MSHTFLIARHIQKIKVFVKWSNQSFINAFILAKVRRVSKRYIMAYGVFDSAILYLFETRMTV